MIALPNEKLLFFADTSVNIEPDAETLAEIAILSAGFVRELKIEPRVALLSFSNFGSAPHRLLQEDGRCRAADQGVGSRLWRWTVRCRPIRP